MPLSLEGRTRNLIARFGDYVQSFGSAPAFNDEQLRAHLETLALRSQLGGAAAAAQSSEFAMALRRTLELWRMNTRGAKLVSPPDFEVSLRRCAADIASFESDHLEAEGLNASAIAGRLWSLIEKLRISATGVRLVACTKALHHLLPNVVVPMDRKFMGAFFGWNTHDWQVKEERIFKQAFVVFREIAHKSQPSQYVGTGWNTSPSKVVDNAIVGYCRATLLDKVRIRRSSHARRNSGFTIRLSPTRRRVWADPSRRARRASGTDGRQYCESLLRLRAALLRPLRNSKLLTKESSGCRVV